MSDSAIEVSDTDPQQCEIEFHVAVGNVFDGCRNVSLSLNG
ncbi:hypothetical protein [Alteromonas gilva]|uniref:Uncharacterized protein n=1 Tax=Alteromonas gilva TaxID=2987522 RepID=A0ABT5L7S9_9ALTE|nr:hypothetical protein [Alteromonas gilva]MDC8833105.1 hypothetical protein [Alteromonas gilva]